MEEKPRARMNVGQALSDNFKEEQLKFLDAQLKFKMGNLFYGQIAASLLTSMFYILPAGRLIAQDEEKAQIFVNSLDNFRMELYSYASARGENDLNHEKFYPLNDSFMEIDNKFDALVRQFYKIMYEVGFSP